jgi:hypothetical protein
MFVKLVIVFATVGIVLIIVIVKLVEAVTDKY